MDHEHTTESSEIVAVTVESDRVYDHLQLPTFEWQTYQRGFQGVLNNAYNQSCNTGHEKTLGQMSDITADFREQGGGSYRRFVRFYIDEYNGLQRIRRARDRMARNLINRVESIGGSLKAKKARYWAGRYIWSMIANTYRGFCSEATAIAIVAAAVDEPYRIDTTTAQESNGIDGWIGEKSVQVKPETYEDTHDWTTVQANRLIEYTNNDDEYVFSYYSL